MFGLEKLIGIPEDQFNLIFFLIISCVLSHCFHYVQGTSTRHLYALVPGVFFQLVLFGKQNLITAGFVIGTYAAVKILKRHSGWPVFFGSLIALFIYHIQRMLTNYGSWDMEVSTSLMIYVCKFTMFAWCYCDGDPKRAGKLSADQELRKIEHLPSFYHYCCYIFFFPTSIIGPANTYYDYECYIERKGNYKDIPSCSGRVLFLLGQVLVLAFIAIVLVPKYNWTYALEDEFYTRPFWYRLWYVNVTSLFRAQYYFAFKMAQTNITFAGFAYGGKKKDATGKEVDDWEGICVVRTRLEFNYSPREKVQNWNMAVQNWLQNYVYLRVCPEEKAKTNPGLGNLAFMSTFLTSAFWHGCYPGYYIAFFYWGFVLQCAKKVFRIRDRFNVIAHPVFYPLKWMFVNTFFNYGGMLFYLLDIKTNLRFQASTYFLFPILVLGFNFFGDMIPFFRPPRSGKSKKPAAEVEMTTKDGGEKAKTN